MKVAGKILRDYQEKATKKIVKSWNKSWWQWRLSKSPLLAAATGSGKTLIAISSLMMDWKEDSKALVIAPTIRVVEQWRQELEAEGFICGVAGHDKNIDRNPDQVEVVMMTTVKFAMSGVGEFNFSHIIFDECHRLSPTILKRKEELKSGKLLGMTATPFRTDGVKMSEVFDSVIDIRKDSLEYLTPTKIINMRPWENKIAQTLTIADEEVNGNGRKGIVFTTTVEEAEEIAFLMGEHDIQAKAITHENNDEDFSESQIVVTINVLKEGVNFKDADLLIIMNPSKVSLTQFFQRVGRVMRPNKRGDSIVYLLDENVRHEMPVWFE